jgi:glycosyltransferase involved in cell wall biosynthesis
MSQACATKPYEAISLMLIWLVKIGEPVPVEDGLNDRLLRTGLMAHLLAKHGHEVVWWTSTFDHIRKKHRFECDHCVKVRDGLEIRLLHGCGYQSNVSLSRLRDHRQIARRFAALAEDMPRRPDIIVAGMPPIETSREAITYARRHGVPVVLDIVDWWPDVFLDVLPRLLRLPGYVLLTPLFLTLRAVCRETTAITGTTEQFVDWGLQRGGRRRSAWDRSFNIGYMRTPLPTDELLRAARHWDELGITAGNGEFNVVFFGNIGRQFALVPVLEAARLLRATGRRIHFVLCGAGDRLEHYRSLAAGLDNVSFPGWVDAAQIRVLMQRSAVGLAPYVDRRDFAMNIPSKPAEYLSGGLPIALSLDHGVLCDLLRERDCGFSYGGDAQKLADRLCRLYECPQEVRRLSSNAKALFEEEFVADTICSEMAAHLERIVAATKNGERPAAEDQL